MGEEQRRSEEQGKEEERDEKMQDLDVSKEESEDVRGGLSRTYEKK